MALAHVVQVFLGYPAVAHVFVRELCAVRAVMALAVAGRESFKVAAGIEGLVVDIGAFLDVVEPDARAHQVKQVAVIRFLKVGGAAAQDLAGEHVSPHNLEKVRSSGLGVEPEFLWAHPVRAEDLAAVFLDALTAGK